MRPCSCRCFSCGLRSSKAPTWVAGSVRGQSWFLFPRLQNHPNHYSTIRPGLDWSPASEDLGHPRILCHLHEVLFGIRDFFKSGLLGQSAIQMHLPHICACSACVHAASFWHCLCCCCLCALIALRIAHIRRHPVEYERRKQVSGASLGTRCVWHMLLAETCDSCRFSFKAKPCLNLPILLCSTDGKNSKISALKHEF